MTRGMNQQVAALTNRTIYDRDGDKIGSVKQVWEDDQTHQPEWVTVHTGLFGANESFIPVQGMCQRGQDELQTPFSKQEVKDAPHVRPDEGHLDREAEQQLYAHYHLDQQQAAAPQGRGNAGGRGRGRGDSGDAMTRSEERLRVGTEQHETGRARLRKYVVTETEQVNVPVTKEKVRLEREPITEANRGQAMSGEPITEAEHEVTLHEERPVVDTETVPVERVRLRKEQETATETVSRDLRKERIRAEGDIEDRPDRQNRKR